MRCLAKERNLRALCAMRHLRLRTLSSPGNDEGSGEQHWQDEMADKDAAGYRLLAENFPGLMSVRLQVHFLQDDPQTDALQARSVGRIMRCVAIFGKAAVKLFLQPSGIQGHQSATGQQSIWRSSKRVSSV